MKCPLCKRRKFTDEDELFFKNTGRCKICDLRIHREDFIRERHEKLRTKSAQDLSQHSHIYVTGYEEEAK